jgi:hypothetical protein
MQHSNQAPTGLVLNIESNNCSVAPACKGMQRLFDEKPSLHGVVLAF